MRLGAIALFAALLAAPTLAHAEEEAAIALSPGTQLEAVDNVTLQRAEIAKGSKVAVAAVIKHEGKVAGVSLELGDGHVVKVGLATVHNFFRVVD
jgi:hypothetical protein